MHKSVELFGGFLSCDLGNRSGRTEITGNGSHSVFEVLGDTLDRMTVTFRDLDISGGGADVDHGGGIQLAGTNRLILDNTFVHNNMSARGAGIYFDGSLGGQLIVSLGSQIGAFNEATISGGGIYCINAPQGMNTGILVSDSNIGFNFASSGGGIFLDNCYLRLISRDNYGVTFNNAVNGGGGLFATNSSVILAEGAFVNPSSPPDARLFITNNSATNANGGGVYLDGGSSAVFRDTDLSLNVASNASGGGLYAISADSVRFERNLTSRCKETCSRITGNNAINGMGGGVVSINTDLEFQKTNISDNEADQASAVHVNNAELFMHSVLVTGNEGADEVVELVTVDSNIRYVSFADNLNQLVDISAFGGNLQLLSSIFDEQQGSVVSTGGGVIPTFGCLMVHETASLPSASEYCHRRPNVSRSGRQ